MTHIKIQLQAHGDETAAIELGCWGLGSRRKEWRTKCRWAEQRRLDSFPPGCHASWLALALSVPHACPISRVRLVCRPCELGGSGPNKGRVEELETLPALETAGAARLHPPWRATARNPLAAAALLRLRQIRSPFRFRQPRKYGPYPKGPVWTRDSLPLLEALAVPKAVCCAQTAA